LNSRKPSSLNGAGERSSHAQKAVSGLPAAWIMRAIAANPAGIGSGVWNRTRRILKPAEAATPAEY
jgi:hypothetical protein